MTPLPEPRVERWASIERTAAYLGLSRMTVYRMIGSGLIASVHVGRRHLIDLRSVDRALETASTPTPGVPDDEDLHPPA